MENVREVVDFVTKYTDNISTGKASNKKSINLADRIFSAFSKTSITTIEEAAKSINMETKGSGFRMMKLRFSVYLLRKLSAVELDMENKDPLHRAKYLCSLYQHCIRILLLPTS